MKLKILLIPLMLLLLLSIATAQPSGGVSFYNFEENGGGTLVDSWNGYDGSIAGMTWGSWVPQFNISGDGGNYSGSFDGTDDEVTLDPNDYAGTYSAFSVNVWLNKSTWVLGGGVFDAVYSFYDATGGLNIIEMSFNENDGFYAWVGTQGTSKQLINATSDFGLVDNEDYLFTFQYDGTDVELFIDCTLVNSDTTSGNVVFDTSMDKLSLGTDNSGSRDYQGSMDYFKFFDRSLNSTERMNLCNYGNITAPVTPIPPSNTTLSLGTPSPSTGSNFNVSNVEFSVPVNFSNVTSCELNLNGTLNDSLMLNFPSASVNTGAITNVGNLVDGNNATFSDFTFQATSLVNISRYQVDRNETNFSVNILMDDLGNGFLEVYCFDSVSGGHLLGTSQPVATGQRTITFNGSKSVCFHSDNLELLLSSKAGVGDDIRIYEVQTNPLANISFETSFSNGFYEYNITCNDSVNAVSTSNNEFLVDVISPLLKTSFVNDSIWFNKFLSVYFNVTDNLMVYSVNASVDGTTFYYNNTLGGGAFVEFNLSRGIGDLSVGDHNLTLRVADGHTSAKLKSGYDVGTGLFDKGIKYKIDKDKDSKVDLTISFYEDTLINGDWDYIEKFDRMSELYDPLIKQNKYTFIVESSSYINIVSKDGHYKGSWLVIDDYWKDFVLKNEPNSKVKIKRLTDYKVEIEVSGVEGSVLEFESTGELNVVEETYNFIVANASSQFEILLFDGFETSLNLSVLFNSAVLNVSGLTSTAVLNWNDTSYPASLVSISNKSAVFNVNITPITSDVIELVNHNWSFNINPLTSGNLYTNTSSQIIWNVLVEECTNPLTNYTILNVSYFDEITNNPINTSVSWSLSFFDGLFSYLNEDNDVATYTEFCTNINPANVTYNWATNGTFSLSKTGYVSRIYNYPRANNISVSNNPVTDLDLFLIEINDSTTISYTWLTDEYQPVSGVMNIYVCNSDGSRSLVDAPLIIDGFTTANLQLLTIPYAYEVVIGSTLYVDNNKWSQCHVESATSLQFFVDVGILDLDSLIGLQGVACKVSLVGNDSVSLTYGSNIYDSNVIVGCLNAISPSFVGEVVLDSDCTSTGSLVVNYSSFIGTDSFFVYGLLNQSGNQVQCMQSVEFVVTSTALNLWAGTALFGVFLLMTMFALIFIKNQELGLIAAVIPFIGSWIVGFLNFGWATASAVVIFALLIAFVGRYNRTLK